MKKSATLIFLAAIMSCTAVAAISRVLANSGRSDARDKQPVTNKRCPVTGDGVNPNLRIEYQGQYVYFCCDGCPEQFKSDPAKYIAKMSTEDREAIKANEKCPVTGDAVNKDLWLESEGRKVYFCCPNCVAEFKKDHKVTAASKEASAH
ncbi:MAG: YHS domain-containing protein [Blastocatellia bacterium]